jgi:hypothetical protein
MKMLSILAVAGFLWWGGAAQAELVTSGVDSAENTLQTSSQRMFASSTGAFYEVTKTASGWTKTELSYKFKDGHSGSCYFLGITELAGMVYTVCTESTINPLAKKHLFGFGVNDISPHLTELGELKGMALPNGLTTDGSGNLYVADSGLPLLPGSIHKIPLTGPYSMGTKSVFHSFAACKPNGLRFSNGKLYVSVDPFSYVGLSQLLRYDLTPGGLTNKAVIFTSWSFLDDFALVKGGAVAAEFFGGRIVHITEEGKLLHSASFAQPSSVSMATAPAFGPGSLFVTERGKGNIVRLVNDWGLLPR